jgi:O-antigen ligase
MFLCVERLLIFGTPISRIMIAMAAATAIPMTFGLLGERLGADTYHLNAGVRALRSTFVLSNNFAYFLLPVIVLAIPIGHRSRGSLRLGLYALAALGSVLLVLTQTRGAWIGAVAGVVVIGILENRRLILALLAIVTCALVLAPGVNDRVTEISTETQARRDENSLEWRLEQWAEIVDWNDQNRLTGIGLGMVIQLDEAAKAPHNDYLRAYVETGVVGLSFYILLVGGFVRAAWIGHRRQLAGWQGGLLVGIFAYSIVFAITSIAENLIVSVAFLWYAMTLGAIANFVAYNDRSADLAGDGRRKRVVNSARDEVKA